MILCGLKIFTDEINEQHFSGGRWGYIGSHMVFNLTEAGHDVVVFDSLSAGYADAVIGAPLVEADLADAAALDKVFSEGRFDVVMHFASSIQVGESVQKPDLYYRNNVSNTLNLLDAMVKHNVKHFIFSSTAAIFGEPEYSPIDEAHPKNPINPYGRTKWMVEQILQDYDHAYGLKSVCLRYFNAAGADSQARVGERHEPETHLIPLVLQAACGQREHISVFGRDYNTPDGTCLRDYIHVSDLCDAHALAIDYVVEHNQSAQFNLGNGQGFSVQQVIDVAKTVTGKRIEIVDAERRTGDPAELVADSTQAQKVLGWTPRYADLNTLVAHAWTFMVSRNA
jgi:UDP-glucose 4-epimerase